MRKRNNVISFFGVLLMIVNMCSVITHNKSYSKETAKNYSLYKSNIETFLSKTNNDKNNFINSENFLKKSYEDDNVSVTVHYKESAKIPNNAKLNVKKINDDSKEYKELKKEAERQIENIYGNKEKPTVESYNLFDISFVMNDEKIEPSEKVFVKLQIKKGKSVSSNSNFIVGHHIEGKMEVVGNKPLSEKSEDSKVEDVMKDNFEKNEKSQLYKADVKSDGKVEVIFSTDSFSPYSAIALRSPYGAPYDVWFDGTLGLGEELSLVKGAKNEHMTTDNWGYVKLPSDRGYNQKYKLIGWYNIYTNQWHKAGETVRLDRDTVFYAEWIQRDYNLNPNGTLVNNQHDTSSFVKTDVFDYNEIFNAKHGAKLANDNGTYIQNSNWGYSGAHGEVWSGNDNTSFIFTNWYNHTFTHQNLRTLGFPRNLEKVKNEYDSNNSHKIYKDIVKSKNDQLIKDLFDKKNEPGKQYLGKGNFLFQYDFDGNATKDRYNGKFGKGYYYYDSDFNGADYNKDKQRFYVYNNVQNIQGEERTNNGWKNSGSKKPGFMPFEQGTVKEKSGQINYWFGMKTDVDFFLPDDVGSNGGNCNKSEANKDMRFYFSGDDDVWVFVDNIKVLDLGGIHGRVAGDINFSTGVITYENPNSPGTTLAVDRDLLKKIKSGDHKLTIYYLERGSSQSNCSIYFNLAPRYNLQITKQDKDSKQLLSDAEFSVYLDKDLSIPAMLWDSEQAYKNKEEQKYTFKTINGKVNCYGFLAGRTYYLKETKAPDNYPSVSDKIIKLKLDATGNVSLVDTDPDFCEITSKENINIGLTVNNKKIDETSVKVLKNWYDTDGSDLENNIPKDVEVTLYRSTFENSGGSSGSNVKVPIKLTTQHFGYANGSNTDTSNLVSGDYNNSTTAFIGGKLQLKVDLTTQNAGIYSVTANGKPLKMIKSGQKTTQNMYMYGSWGNHPYREATYEIDPITEGLDIKVTVIGYLNYIPGTGTPSLSHSMNTTFTSTSPKPNSGLPITPPTIKPADAEKVTHNRFGQLIENPIKLSNLNSWEYEWKHLDVKDSKGKNYYYYVEEKVVSGFSTSYTGNGVLNGTVEIDNTKLKEIVVLKKWVNSDGSEMSDEQVPVDEIIGILVQEDTTTSYKKNINFTLTKNKKWKIRWDTEELGEKKGHKYKYYVKEISVDGFNTSYENNNGVSETTDDNPIVIKNTSNHFDFKVIKYGINNKVLEGAEFTIYSNSSCTNEVFGYENKNLKGKKQSVFITDNEGKFTVYGLKAGDYWIKETRAPKGYRLLEKAIQIRISNKGELTLVKYGQNDNVKIKNDTSGRFISVTDRLEKIQYPKTGGTGVKEYMIFGLFFVTGGFLIKKYLNKKSKQF